jgi:hypothetical protein
MAMMSTLEGMRRRRFFVIMASAVILIVFAGFAPTFYLRGSFTQDRPMSVLLHVHGIVFSAWVIIFLVQALLIARGSRRLHQRCTHRCGSNRPGQGRILAAVDHLFERATAACCVMQTRSVQTPTLGSRSLDPLLPTARSLRWIQAQDFPGPTVPRYSPPTWRWQCLPHSRLMRRFQSVHMLP